MAVKKTANTIPPESLALYEKLIADLPGIELRGATMPYTSLNGNMFSFLFPEGPLALRMSPQDRDAFLEKYPAAVCMAHGVLMKEYIAVPQKLLGSTATMKKLFACTYSYAASLKPKKTTKEKKK